MRHTIAMNLLSNSQTDSNISLERASATNISSAHSLSGMAVIGGFGIGPARLATSVSSAPVDLSSSQSSQKQRRRSANMIRAPIASAEELSPTSPQESDAHDIRQLPVDSKSNVHKSDAELKTARLDHGVAGVKTKTAHISDIANLKDGDMSERYASSATNKPSYKPAKLGKTSAPFSAAVSEQYVDDGLPSTLPSIPGAVRRPDSFVHAMSDQLVIATGPRRGRAAQSPSLETQPEEEMSGVFEFSV